MLEKQLFRIRQQIDLYRLVHTFSNRQLQLVAHLLRVVFNLSPSAELSYLYNLGMYELNQVPHVRSHTKSGAGRAALRRHEDQVERLGRRQRGELVAEDVLGVGGSSCDGLQLGALVLGPFADEGLDVGRYFYYGL